MVFIGVFHMENEKINANHTSTYKLILTEWLTTIAVFVARSGYLAHKIERQADRTDRLYEMFIDLLKEKNRI
jgi:hypothetical protein